VKLLPGFAKSLFIYLVLCISTYLMLRILIDYTAFQNDVGFLRFKAPYVNYPRWKAAPICLDFGQMYKALLGKYHNNCRQQQLGLFGAKGKIEAAHPCIISN
jgi:hypothetical protein